MSLCPLAAVLGQNDGFAIVRIHRPPRHPSRMIAHPLRSPAGLSLVLLALAITLPFLDPRHFDPIATFRQEWLAGMLGLMALVPLATNPGGQWTIPRSALLPCGMIVLLIIQFVAGVDVRFESSLLAALYLVWMLALLIVARRACDELGRDPAATLLAFSLVTGSCLLALSGAAQRWAPGIGMPWVFPSATIKGNVAQANSFASYLWIGIAAASWLFVRGQLPRWLLVLLLPSFIGLTLMSGSRSVYIYGAALSIWLLAWSRLEQGKARQRSLLLALSLLPLLALVQGLSSMVAGDVVASAQRIAAQGSYDPVRLNLWQAAWRIFTDHPLLGAGFDSYSRLFFERIAEHPINGAGIPEHSHNLVTEVAAEFGIAGLAVLAATIVITVLGVVRRPDQPTLLAAAVLIVIGVHALLEYPLWYAHFLAIATIMLSICDTGGHALQAASRHRLLLLGIALAGAAVLTGLRNDYLRLEDSARGFENGAPITAARQHQILLETYSGSLLRPYAALQFASRMPLDSEELAGRLALMKEAQHFSPIRGAVYRHAALLWLAGEEAEALRQWQRAALAYPGEQAHALALLGEAARQEPDLRVFMERCCVQRSF